MSPALVGGFFTTSTTWEVGHMDPKEHGTWVEIHLEIQICLQMDLKRGMASLVRANHVNYLHPCGVMVAFRAMTSQTTGLFRSLNREPPGDLTLGRNRTIMNLFKALP